MDVFAFFVVCIVNDSMKVFLAGACHALLPFDLECFIQDSWPDCIILLHISGQG